MNITINNLIKAIFKLSYSFKLFIGINYLQSKSYDYKY